jgi:hypothetical protein
MTDTEIASTPAVAPQGLSPQIAEALAAYHGGNPDTPPSVRIRSAYRNIGCNGSGPEVYRRVRYPGSTEEVWPDGDRLPRLDGRAGTRRATVYTEVPLGTLVVDYERERYRGAGGKCKVTIGLVYRGENGKGEIEWLKHRVLRSHPLYEVTLPDGALAQVARREH